MAISDAAMVVIADLQRQRAEITALIDAMLSLYGAGGEPEPTFPPLWNPAEVPLAPVIETRLNERGNPVVAKGPSVPGTTNKGDSLSVEIRRAIVGSEKRLNAIQVADVVCKKRPDFARASVSTVVSQLIQKGEFRKHEDLTISPNGAP